MREVVAWVRRTLAGPLAASLIAPLISTPTAPDDHRRPTGATGLVWRKDGLAEDCEPGPVATFGTLYNTHTGEASPLSDSEPEPERFSSLLEDRVTGSRTRMDPALIGLLRGLCRGRAPARVELVSGYRSWKLNEQLRKKGRRVASHSQHSLGEAVDFRIGGVATKALKQEIERSGWKGGIGYYPKPSDRFVHADAGPVRKWVGR